MVQDLSFLSCLSFTFSFLSLCTSNIILLFNMLPFKVCFSRISFVSTYIIFLNHVFAIHVLLALWYDGHNTVQLDGFVLLTYFILFLSCRTNQKSPRDYERFNLFTCFGEGNKVNYLVIFTLLVIKVSLI